MLAERPEVARRFVRAFVLGLRMALANPGDVAQSMQALFPELDEETVEQQFKTIVPLIRNAISKSLKQWVAFDRARVGKTWEWTARARDIPLDRMDPEKAIDAIVSAKVTAPTSARAPRVCAMRWAAPPQISRSAVG